MFVLGCRAALSTSGGAITVTAAMGAISDSSGADLTPRPRISKVLGPGARYIGTAAAGAIGGAGTSRLDIAVGGLNAILVLSATGRTR